MGTRNTRLGRGALRHCCLSSFQQLRRIEETSPGGLVSCISCGRAMPWQEAQGGHYIPRSCAATEMERDNVFPQCAYCNCALSGNLREYRRRLSERIGEDRVLRLEAMRDASNGSEEAMETLSAADRASVSMKRSRGYYEERYMELRKEIKEAKRRKGIGD